MKDRTAMCAEGGFSLTTFESYSRDVLVFIPEEERTKSLQDQELRAGKLANRIGSCYSLEYRKRLTGFYLKLQL